MDEIAGVPGAYLLHGVLTRGECEWVISEAENTGFAPKKSRRSGPPIRNNTRVIYEPDLALTRALEERLLPQVERASTSPMGAGWRLTGGGFVNTKWRINRYDSGEAFLPHFDTGHVFNPAKRTLFSLIIYLNEDFQ